MSEKFSGLRLFCMRGALSLHCLFIKISTLMVLSFRSLGLTALLGLVPVVGAFAQCTPSTSACSFNPQVYFGSVCFTPDPLPDGTVGQPYNEAIRFVAAQAITQPLPLTLSKVEVLNVRFYDAAGALQDAATVGLTVTLTSGNSVDNPNIATAKAFTPVPGNGFGPFGCIQISGTPNREIDSLSLSIRINDAIEIPGPVSQTPINLDFRVNPASACNINASTSSTSSACASATGSITVTASGGAAPYEYSINGGPDQASNQFSNLAVGTYNIVVKDNAGCSKSVTATVEGQSKPSASVSLTLPLCFGEKGSVQVVASNGTAPYTYKFDDGNFQASDSKADLNAGNYSVVVKDANGCESAAETFSIPAIAELTASIAQTSAGCSANQKNVVVSASGGTSPYTYSSDGTSFQSSNTLACLGAGTYSITVKDANDCTNVTSVTITGTDVAAKRYTALRVYPNPATGSRFQVELTGVSVREARLSLTDAQGRVVWSHTATATASTLVAEVPTTGLAAGVYTLASPAIGLTHKVVVR
jgi:hypothetical protein